jgi:hypothetical protein
VQKNQTRTAACSSCCAVLLSLEEAVAKAGEKGYFVGDRFGIRKEVFVRKAYLEMLELIHDKWAQSVSRGRDITLAIVQGSSGVGKSVFLAYAMARYRMGDVKNVALFHANKTLKSGTGSVDNDKVTCSVWLDSQKVIEGKYGNEGENIEQIISKVDLIIMDGCSMPIGLGETATGFKGLVLVSASPSLYVKNLLDAIPTNHFRFTMPPIPKEEALLMKRIVGVDEVLVEENFT